MSPRSLLGCGALLAALAACAETPAGPDPTLVVDPAHPLSLSCTVSLVQQRVTCNRPAPGPRAAVITGQGADVMMAGTNVVYAGGVFSFDATVQSLLPERMGTVDGVTPHADGIQVFFNRQPVVTAGSGEIEILNETGEGAFTAANQPFYRYEAVLDSGEVSPPLQWQFAVPATVESFAFQVTIDTRLEPLLVINEIMANPGGTVQDTTGEYVELYNAGRFAVNLAGFQLADNGASHVVAGDLVLGPAEYLLLGRSQNLAKNGGITVDYLYVASSTTTSLQFSNSGTDFFRVRAPTGVTVDSAGYTSSSTAAMSGVSRELRSFGLDNSAVDGPSWQSGTSSYFAANAGTPRMPNTPPP